MALLVDAIKTLLRADAGLTALVGARSYLEEAPKAAALPYVRFFEVSGVSADFEELSEAVELESTRVQFRCWAESAREAILVRRAVLLALRNYRGTVEIAGSGSPPETFVIQASIPDVRVTLYDEERPTEKGSRGRAIDFIFHHAP